MMRKMFGYLAVSLIILCCKGKDPTNSLPVDSTSSKRLIPYSADSSLQGKRKEPFLKNLSSLMQLPFIYNGTQNLNIRIWLWAGEKKYVLDISKNGVTNNCYIAAFNSKIIDSVEYIEIHREWKELQPKSGWANFFEAVEKYHVLDLESGNIHEKKPGDLTSMAYVQFEIARPQQYRYYDYLEPSYYRFIDSGSNNVFRFLEYLNQEFGVNVYYPKNAFY